MKTRASALLTVALLIVNSGCVDLTALSPTDSVDEEIPDGETGLSEWEDEWAGWVEFGEMAMGDESEMYARTVPEVATAGDTVTVEVVIGSLYGRPMPPVSVRMAEPAGDLYADVDPASGPEWVSMTMTGGRITNSDGNLVQVQGDERGDVDWGESSYTAELTVPDGRTMLHFKVRAFDDEPETAFTGWDVTAPSAGLFD